MAKYKITFLSITGRSGGGRSSLHFAALVLTGVIFCSTQIVSCNKSTSGASNVDTHTVKADGSIMFNSYKFSQLGLDQTLDPEGPYYPATITYPTKWPAWLTFPDGTLIAGEQKKILAGISNTPDGSFQSLKVGGIVEMTPKQFKDWIKDKTDSAGYEYVEREPTVWVEDVLINQDIWLTKNGSNRKVFVSLDYGKRWGSYVHIVVSVWLLDEKAK